MIERYMDHGKKLGRFRCVSIKNVDEASYDLCLSGERGDIWYAGRGVYKAMIAFPAGSEKIISFHSHDLEKWVYRLKVPANPADQVFWANNPNARHKERS